MATNFSGGIVASDGFKISVKNRPMDIRTRIESVDEMVNIPNPFVGMIIYVSSEDKFYVVKTLKPKSVGAMVITDALIDKYEPLDKGLVTEAMLQEALGIEYDPTELSKVEICGGKGCPFCKGTGWVEILGCGMVDPNVLELNGIDSKVYSGYALGMGIERITNLKYRVNDLRLFSENDTRFLKEFEAAN